MNELLLAIAGGVIGIAAGIIIVLWHRWGNDRDRTEVGFTFRRCTC